MPISRGASSLGIFKMAAVAMETVNFCQNFDLTYIRNCRGISTRLDIYIKKGW
jgi:hypothetical protein